MIKDEANNGINKENINRFLDAVKAPCNECDYHKSGESKDCALCRKCEKRIAYNDFIDERMNNNHPSFSCELLTISTDRFKIKGKGKAVQISVKEISLPDNHLNAVVAIVNWDLIKSEYIKSVVPKKMTIEVFVKKFNISHKTLYLRRKKGNWPEIKPPKCKNKKCIRPAEIKGKCKKCYQRVYMRKQTTLKKRKGEKY